MASCVESEWGIEPLLIREGGSIPSLPFLEREFQADAVHFPMGTSSDSAHLPDERIKIVNLEVRRHERALPAGSGSRAHIYSCRTGNRSFPSGSGHWRRCHKMLAYSFCISCMQSCARLLHGPSSRFRSDVNLGRMQSNRETKMHTVMECLDLASLLVRCCRQLSASSAELLVASCTPFPSFALMT